jgi:hypothetical protein
MTMLPLHLIDGHLFLVVENDLWLIDTGAPSGFGESGSITIAERTFDLGDNYLGMDAETLSDQVGTRCVGLLGADVLGEFDHLFDVPNQTLTVSSERLDHTGQIVPVEHFMDIPVLSVGVGDEDHRMFFDTGAQLSYFQHDSLSDFPAVGSVSDFYPGVGQFETDTHKVPMAIGGITFELQCGKLPELLAMTLMMANTTGIVGNVILQNRVTGYFPRRNELVL